MQKLILLNLNEETELPKKNEILNLLSSERKSKVLKLKNEKAFFESAFSELLLKYSLKDFKQVEFSYNYINNNKPIFKNNPELNFSLSHSNGFIFCVIDDKFPIGADIQVHTNAHKNIADRFFHADEITYLNSLSENEKRKAFFDLWSVKESFVKCTGDGFKFKFSEFCVKTEFSNYKIIQNRYNNNFFFKIYNIISDTSIAVTSINNNFCEKIELISVNQLILS